MRLGATVTISCRIISFHQGAAQAAASQNNEDSGIASPTLPTSQELQPQIHHHQLHNQQQHHQQDLQKQQTALPQQQQMQQQQTSETMAEYQGTDHVKKSRQNGTVGGDVASADSLTASPEHNNLIAMATNAAIASGHGQNVLTTISYENVHETSVIATNETTVTKATTTVNKTMEAHLATETQVSKTSQTQEVTHTDNNQSNGSTVHNIETNTQPLNYASETVDFVQDVKSSTAQVPTITPVTGKENMAAKEVSNAGALTNDVMNIDVVDVNRREVHVENDVKLQANSDTVTMTTSGSGPAAATVSPDLVAQFMGRDGVDGHRNQSNSIVVCGNQLNGVETPERRTGGVNDTLYSAHAPDMRLPVDSSTPLRVYQVQYHPQLHNCNS